MTQRRVNPNTKKLKDIYESFIKKHPDIAEKIKDYKQYREIILELNTGAQDIILSGKPLEMGHKMGRIELLRFNRFFAVTSTGRPKLPVDWGATKKLWNSDPQAKALKKRIMFTDAQYLGIVWRRQACFVRGKTIYGFDSSRTNGGESKKGLKNRLVKMIRENPMIIEQFRVNNKKQ